MTYTYKNFKITANYVGGKPAPFMKENKNYHRVTVTNTENGKRTGFDFWASIASPRLTSRYDVINAFYCFVSDAISGDMDAAEFNREFGYNDHKEALRAWKGCKAALEKLTHIYDGDIYELSNELSENYG